MIKTKAYQARGVENFVKTVLTLELIEQGDSLLELYCNDGLDMGKWVRAQVKRYVGVEPNSNMLKDAKKNWEKRGKPFDAMFICCDPSQHQKHDPSPTTNQNLCNATTNTKNGIIGDKMEDDKLLDELFDAVACFGGFDNYLSSEEKAQHVLQYAFDHMKDGAYFMGSMLDSSTIWNKAQKVQLSQNDEEIVIKNDLYSLHVHSILFDKHWGTECTLKVNGEEKKEYKKQFLIHYPSLLRIANKIGFEVVSTANCQEFLEDNRNLYLEHLEAYGVFKSSASKKISASQMDMISLFSIFIFYKPPVQKNQKKLYQLIEKSMYGEDS